MCFILNLVSKVYNIQKMDEDFMTIREANLNKFMNNISSQFLQEMRSFVHNNQDKILGQRKRGISIYQDIRLIVAIKDHQMSTPDWIITVMQVIRMVKQHRNEKRLYNRITEQISKLDVGTIKQHMHKRQNLYFPLDVLQTNPLNQKLFEHYRNYNQELKHQSQEMQGIINNLQLQYCKLYCLYQLNERALAQKDKFIYKLVQKNTDSKQLEMTLQKQIKDGRNLQEAESNNSLESINSIKEGEHLEFDIQQKQRTETLFLEQKQFQNQIEQIQNSIALKNQIVKLMSKNFQELQKQLMQSVRQKNQRIDYLRQEMNRKYQQKQDEQNVQKKREITKQIEYLQIQILKVKQKVNELQRQIEVKFKIPC